MCGILIYERLPAAGIQSMWMYGKLVIVIVPGILEVDQDLDISFFLTTNETGGDDDGMQG